jgi:hypothetical protein
VISASTSGRAVSQSSGGESRRPGGGTADQTQGAGEADLVGVQVGGLGGAGDERGEGVLQRSARPGEGISGLFTSLCKAGGH